MFYILGLFLIIGLILGGFTGSLPFGFNTEGITGAIGNVLNDFKKRTFEFIFPESENVILIDNLNENYDLLDRFFSESADSILKSKDVPEKQKKEFKKALEIFQKTKEQIKLIGKEATKNQSGALELIVKKALGLDPTGENESEITSPGPTYMPPNCNVVCSE